MKIFKSMPLSMLGLLLVAGLAAGCGSAVDDDDGAELSSADQELVFLSVQEGDADSQAVSLAYTPVEGWHLKFTDHLLPTNLKGAENVDIRHQALDFGGDFDAEGSSRFDASLAGPASFSANVPRANGFNAGMRVSHNFSAGVDRAGGFSAGLSYGGSCSLQGLCDFVEVVCNAAPSGADGCPSGTIAQCRADISQIQGQIPPDARPFVCGISDFFSCATNALNNNSEQQFEQCATQNGGAGLLGIFFVAGLLNG